MIIRLHLQDHIYIYRILEELNGTDPLNQAQWQLYSSCLDRISLRVLRENDKDRVPLVVSQELLKVKQAGVTLREQCAGGQEAAEAVAE